MTALKGRLIFSELAISSLSIYRRLSGTLSEPRISHIDRRKLVGRFKLSLFVGHEKLEQYRGTKKSQAQFELLAHWNE